MSLIHFLPGVLKEVLKHVPKLAFDAADWGSLMRDLPRVSGRLFSEKGVAGLKETQSRKLAPYISFSKEDAERKSGDPIHRSEGILRYYFAQLQCKEGVFLDLREHHFSDTPGGLVFKPNGLWHRFSDSFQSGLEKLYDGFYSKNAPLFEEGLILTGLLNPRWPLETKEELKTLFKSHFGSSLEVPVRLTLDSLQESMMNLLKFLIREKVRLSSEFMLFGVMLVTLYLALESDPDPLPVKKIFEEVRKGRTG